MEALPPITPVEIVLITFDFTNVAVGTLTVPLLDKETISGTDPAAVGLTLGTPTIVGSTMQFTAHGIVNNVSYRITGTVTDGTLKHQAACTITVTGSAL